MISAVKRLEAAYYSGNNVKDISGDFQKKDTNININNPMRVSGTLGLQGNVSLNAAVRGLVVLYMHRRVQSH